LLRLVIKYYCGDYPYAIVGRRNCEQFSTVLGCDCTEVFARLHPPCPVLSPRPFLGVLPALLTRRTPRCGRSTVSRHYSMIHGDSRPTRSRGNRCGKAIRSCSYIHSCYAFTMRNWASGNKSRAASHQLLFPVIAAIIFAFWHARCGLANRPRNARPGREVFPASVSERLGENSQAHRPAAARRPAPCR
jgi:hypothetical protein